MIDKLLKKARQSLTTARLDLEAGDTDASVNRSYYAAFYAAWAMFEAAGVDKPKKHSGMISEFGRRFVKEGRWTRPWVQRSRGWRIYGISRTTL